MRLSKLTFPVLRVQGEKTDLRFFFYGGFDIDLDKGFSLFGILHSPEHKVGFLINFAIYETEWQI